MKQKLPSFNPDSSFQTSSLITCQSSEVIATKTVEREIKKIISLLEYKKLEFLSRDSSWQPKKLEFLSCEKIWGVWGFVDKITPITLIRNEFCVFFSRIMTMCWFWTFLLTEIVVYLQVYTDTALYVCTGVYCALLTLVTVHTNHTLVLQLPGESEKEKWIPKNEGIRLKS